MLPPRPLEEAPSFLFPASGGPRIPWLWQHLTSSPSSVVLSLCVSVSFCGPLPVCLCALPYLVGEHSHWISGPL